MTRFSIETQKSRHENFPLYIKAATIEEVIHSTDIVDNLSINRSHATINFPAKRRQWTPTDTNRHAILIISRLNCQYYNEVPAIHSFLKQLVKLYLS